MTETGFTSLFDGTPESAKANWRGFKKDHLPDGWQVQDGLLVMTQKGSGDIVTVQTFSDFDLRLEWKISEGGNSGVFYRIAADDEAQEATWHTGLEMQVLDDDRHADARNGRDRMAGTLYALFEAPDPSPVKPAGQWNSARIVADGNHLEHYLNDQLMMKTEIGSDDWNRRVEASKFIKLPEFAKHHSGRIGLQDHGNLVWYRNIRIKPL